MNTLNEQVLYLSERRSLYVGRIHGQLVLSGASAQLIVSLGGMISRNKEAYTYLPNSIDEFLTQDNLCEELKQAGLEPIYVKGFSMNISTLFIARKV